MSIIEGSTDVLTYSVALGDVDGDGIVDSLDNCPNTANSNQRDGDSNGEGDVCEDSDGDGVLDGEDYFHIFQIQIKKILILTVPVVRVMHHWMRLNWR